MTESSAYSSDICIFILLKKIKYISYSNIAYTIILFFTPFFPPLIPKFQTLKIINFKLINVLQDLSHIFLP